MGFEEKKEKRKSESKNVKERNREELENIKQTAQKQKPPVSSAHAPMWRCLILSFAFYLLNYAPPPIPSHSLTPFPTHKIILFLTFTTLNTVVPLF